MSFTDQKRFVATAEDSQRVWGSGFKCGLCGHKFVEGDGLRWVYANGNSPSYCNFFTCDTCDGPDVLQRRTAAGDFAKSLDFDEVVIAAHALKSGERVAAPPEPAEQDEDLTDHRLGAYLNTMVAELKIQGKGAYLRKLFRGYESETAASRLRLERLEGALREISEPIPFMRKRAEAEGGQLNGQMAVALSNDANFLKSIARAALGGEVS